MKKIDVAQCMSEAWDLFKQNAVGLILLYFVYFMASGFISSFGGGSPLAALEAIKTGNTEAAMNSNPSSLPSILSYVFSAVFMVGFTILNLRIVRKQAVADMSCIKDAYNQSGNLFLKMAGAHILLGLVEGLGYVCCIIPGIFLSARLGFVHELIYDNPEMGVVDAFKASWELTSGNSGSLMGLVVMTIVIAIAGLICCCIGIVAAVPFTALISTVAYVTMHDNNDPSESNVPTL